MSHPGVTVIILHPEAPPDAPSLVRAVSDARADLAERHRLGFLAAGATDVRVVAGSPDWTPFGARLREVARHLTRGQGLVVLGSGAVPLATGADRARFVRAAAGGPGSRALANNRYSADIIAIPDAHAILTSIPDLPTDNALPRWLEETAGIGVDDLATSWRMAMDIDTALDLVLLGGRSARALSADDRTRVDDRLARLRAVTADPGAELVIAGRTSPATLTWVMRHSASRTRALVEERGLRTSRPGQRSPASVLGIMLERDGPAALGDLLARLGEAAVVDSRVLLAHRHGPDQRRWPSDADRFASDLLLHERIADPWLRDLTRSAADAPIPVLLGAHSLVGPGLRLAIRPRR